MFFISAKPDKIWKPIKGSIFITATGNRPANWTSSLIFFKDFEHTISLILYRIVRRISIFRSSSPEVFCKKCVPKIFAKSQESTCTRVSLQLSASNFLKKSLGYRCFTTKFMKSLRTSFLQNTYERLLLYFCRALYPKAASNAIAKSRQINWRIKRAKTCTCSSIYFLER